MDDQHHMSEILSRGTRTISANPVQIPTNGRVCAEETGRNVVVTNNNNVVSAAPSGQNSIATATEGVFGGATFNNCTINVAVNIGGSKSPSSPRPKRRRVAVIYDCHSSSDDSQQSKNGPFLGHSNQTNPNQTINGPFQGHHILKKENYRQFTFRYVC